jgi:minor extracellular serine protease Vpr
MKHSMKIFFLTVIFVSSIIISQFFEENGSVQVFLDKSVPYIGAGYPIESGFDGAGIKIAVIDTGVDYNHPDLFGFGNDDKVIGGYDFVDNDNFPIDTSGHGTEVAGIIAADGQLQGVAPKSKILAYRVSQDGESVSSDLIIKAIKQAIIDDADIINISLGVNLTNKKIDKAVNEAVKNGIVVVTAAGNHGPNSASIGSPGINPNVITVGATYNNITESLVSTFEVDDRRYQVIPMVGTIPLDRPITSEIRFGEYGREKDLKDIDIKDSIVLVERGSNIEDEIVYFSDKESNAARHGAKAIIVYNNIPGLFFGELIHEFAGEDYLPTIPALSMSREEGLQLRKLLNGNTTGTMDIFYHPDFVAYFSSRGPVSPFYIKPDLVAPGAFVNTTLIDGKYNFTSGTSFAAPHVSGAAALLLNKKIDLQPIEIKSLLVTTTDAVSDAYGKQFDIDITGSGRLNVTKAFDANLIIEPTFLIFNLSHDKNNQSKLLKIKSINQKNDEIKTSFAGNENVDFDYYLDNDNLKITASIKDEFFGTVQDIVFIEQDNSIYNIPIVVHLAKGTINVDELLGEMKFSVSSTEKWSYAKISVINQDNEIIDTTSATPHKDAKITVYDPGQYWIESKIRVNGETIDAYEIVEVTSTQDKKGFDPFSALDVPEKPLLIIFGVVAIIALVGLKIRR